MAGRRDVMNCFKSLVRTSQKVFHEDRVVQEKARQEIRKGFDKNRGETDPTEIAKHIKLGHDVRAELDASVACAVLNPATGHYELRLEEKHLTENAVWPPPPSRRGGERNSNRPPPEGCCGGVGTGS